jgi:hypothetical protein
MVRRSCINSTDDLCIELSSGDYPFHDRQCVCHVFGIGRDNPDQGGINLRPAQGIDPAKKTKSGNRPASSTTPKKTVFESARLQ